jgi:hypothetical protein
MVPTGSEWGLYVNDVILFSYNAYDTSINWEFNEESNKHSYPNTVRIKQKVSGLTKKFQINRKWSNFKTGVWIKEQLIGLTKYTERSSPGKGEAFCKWTVQWTRRTGTPLFPSKNERYLSRHQAINAGGEKEERLCVDSHFYALNLLKLCLSIDPNIQHLSCDAVFWFIQSWA